MNIGEAKNQKDLVAACETARTRRLDLRRGYETIWWNNIALVAGDHYASWNPMTSSFEDRDPNFSATSTAKKPRMVVNHALTTARTELAKLTKSKPVMDVIANSDEQDDVAAAKVGRSALDYAEWRFKLDRLRKQALWWMIQTGLGAIYIGWDSYDDKSGTIEVIIDPTTGEATFNPDRVSELEDMARKGQIEESALQREKIALGEVCFKVFSPFQLLPDETATDFDQIHDLITSEIHDIEVVKGKYGRTAADVRPDNGLQLGTIETRQKAKANVPGGVGSQDVDNAVMVNTFWLEPNIYRDNSFLRNGVMLQWVNGSKVLSFQPAFPYNDGRIPFAFFQHILTSATIWPDSIITHIRDANLEIDKTISQLIENKDYMANPMWLIATQHKIKGEIKNVAGSIVRYRHVPNIPPPQPVPGMQMPQQVEDLLIGLRNQILDISGQSEVSRGRVPSGVRSGVAVAYLQEEDDTKLAPTVDNVEQTVALMGSLTLERFSQFYGFERILRFYRRDGIFDVRKFKGADLKDNTDVVCQAGSAMPKSKASRQQYTLELVSMGIEKDPRHIKEMLEIGEAEPDDIDKAVAQANRENNMMLHGVWKGQTGETIDEDFTKLSAAVPVKAWHNHQVHIARHTSVMMDEEFDDLAITRPEVTRLFDEHLNMHYQQVQAQMQQQAQALMAQKGAPDGPPTPAGGAPPGAAGANGGAQATMMNQAEIPDVIAGGKIKNTARTIRPQ